MIAPPPSHTHNEARATAAPRRLEGLEALAALRRLDLSENRLEELVLGGPLPALVCLQVRGCGGSELPWPGGARPCPLPRSPEEQSHERHARTAPLPAVCVCVCVCRSSPHPAPVPPPVLRQVQGNALATLPSLRLPGLKAHLPGLKALYLQDCTRGRQNGCCLQQGYKAAVLQALPGLSNLDGER